MRKYINLFCSLLLLTGITACSDDFNWNGVEVGEDEYLIAFTAPKSQVEIVSGTRADNRDDVSDLTLLIFNSNGDLLVDPITVDSGSDNFTRPSAETGEGTIKVKRNLVVEGNWYLIANACDKIQEVCNNPTTNGGTLSFSDIKDALTYDDFQFTHAGNVMVAHKDGVTLASGTQTMADVYYLEHLYAQISVKVNDDAVPFRLTRARLTRMIPTGDISLSGTDKTSLLTSGDDDTFRDNWVSPADDECNTFTDAGGQSVKYAKSGITLMQYSYPYTTPANTTDPKQRIMMLVEGYYSAGDFDHVERPCYYAIPIPTIKANHHYKINIIGASEKGADTAVNAEKNPNGILVTFEDDSEDIKNIITDGQNVLAVQDTISIPPGGASPWSFLIKARTLTTGSDKPSITVTPKNSAAAAATWITGLGDYPSWEVRKISNEDENDNSLYSAEITGKVNVIPNNGSERSVVYTISLDGTSLKRDVVFIQRSNTNLKYSGGTDTPISSIRLDIKKGSTTLATIEDYIGFINPSAAKNTPSLKCRGIQPSENGDRIRNLGLHWPMPNGGRTYVYTITLNGSSTISPSTLTYTFKDDEIPDGGTSAYDYVTTSDYITITQGTASFTLDLYHTGFFHNDGTNWYYYEVMKQGDDNLYWLDRNLGASATGMGVRLSNGNYYDSSLPIVGDKAFGGRYSATTATAACPEGWRVPTYPQLRSLTVAAGFGITRRYTDSQEAYYAPSYQFDAVEDGESKKIRSYFPANLLQASSGLAGQAGSGYYLSTTSAGNAGYYKVMQLTGMNVTAQNMNMGNGGNQISVRCCAGSYNPSTEGTVYKCKVEGYTNVYMYYLNNDGSKTSLNTWPGDQIAIYDENETDLKRYHPFEITPTMNYDTNRLYVIFNTVDASGVVIDSNVSATDRAKRRGIKFVMNGSYSKNNRPYGNELSGQIGNWTGSQGGENYDSEQFRLYGNFNSSYGWQNPQQETQFTSKGNGLYELTLNVSSPGKFIVAQYVSGWSKENFAEWKHSTHSDSGTDVENGKTYTLNAISEINYDWRFPATGDYKLTINWKDKTMTVSTSGSDPDPDPTTDYSSWYVNVRGEWNNHQDNGVQPSSAGLSKHTSLNIGNKGFRIKMWDGSKDIWRSNGSSSIPQNEWVTIEDSSDTEMKISGASENDIFDVEWNCNTNQLKVTKVGTSTPTIPAGQGLIILYMKSGTNWSTVALEVENGSNQKSGWGEALTSTGTTSDGYTIYQKYVDKTVWNVNVNNADNKNLWCNIGAIGEGNIVYIEFDDNGAKKLTSGKNAPRRK